MTQAASRVHAREDVGVNDMDFQPVSDRLGVSVCAPAYGPGRKDRLPAIAMGGIRQYNASQQE